MGAQDCCLDRCCCCCCWGLELLLLLPMLLRLLSPLLLLQLQTQLLSLGRSGRRCHLPIKMEPTYLHPPRRRETRGWWLGWGGWV